MPTTRGDAHPEIHRRVPTARADTETENHQRERNDELLKELVATQARQTQLLDAVVEKLGTLRLNGPPPLDERSRRLLLGYRGYRQLLGRPRADRVFVQAVRDLDDVITLQGPLPAGEVTVVAYDTNGNEVGRIRTRAADGVCTARIPNLGSQLVVARVEVLDTTGNPILFGGPIPAQTPQAAQPR